MRAVFPKVSVSDSLFKKPGWLGHATAVGLMQLRRMSPSRYSLSLSVPGLYEGGARLPEYTRP